MQTMSDDEVWRMLHDGHVGMHMMRYCSKVWGILAKHMMLRGKGQACDVCQRHREAHKSNNMGTLNQFS